MIKNNISNINKVISLIVFNIIKTISKKNIIRFLIRKATKNIRKKTNSILKIEKSYGIENYIKSLTNIEDKNNNCLIESITIYILYRINFIDCYLCIGVSKSKFKNAHSWVEVPGRNKRNKERFFYNVMY